MATCYNEDLLGQVKKVNMEAKAKLEQIEKMRTQCAELKLEILKLYRPECLEILHTLKDVIDSENPQQQKSC